MIKLTIPYTDYDGNTREEDFYFNLNKAELMEMQARVGGGLDNFIKKIIAEKDSDKIVQFFKEIIRTAYGKKSLDGRRFEKSKEISDEFCQTEAYSELFMSLAMDADKASEFINGILPKDLDKK